MTANDVRFLEHDDFRVGGVRVPRDLVGGFRDSTDVKEPHELRQRFLDDGYVFLRGVLDTPDVLAARERGVYVVVRDHQLPGQRVSARPASPTSRTAIQTG